MKRRLSELVIVNPPRPSVGLSGDDEISFIAMGDVSESGQWVNKRSRKLKDVKQGFTYFEEGDVLVAKITPCLENGKGCHAVGLENGVGFGSTEFHVLRAKHEADPRFIFHLTNDKEFRLRAEAQMVGSAGQQRVPADFFEGYEVERISKTSQTKIAEVLTKVDQALTQTEALIAKYQRVRTGLMQDLLTKGIDEQGRIRSEATHEFKDSLLGRIPLEWEVKPLKSITSLVIDGTHFTPTYVEHGVPFLRITDIKGSTIDLDRIKYITEKEHNVLSRRCEPQRNDILYSKNGTIGVTKVVDWDWSFSIFVSLALIRPIPELIVPTFLAEILVSECIAWQIRLRSKQLSVTNLHLEEIREFQIPLPSHEEQNRILNVANKTAQLTENEIESFNKLKLKKIGLMQDLLTGKKPVDALLNQATADTLEAAS